MDTRNVFEPHNHTFYNLQKFPSYTDVQCFEVKRNTQAVVVLRRGKEIPQLSNAHFLSSFILIFGQPQLLENKSRTKSQWT